MGAFDQYTESFDPYLDEHVGAIVPADLLAPIQELLTTYRQIEMTEKSFGIGDKEKVFDQVKEDLKKLYTACAIRFSEQ